jgi:type III restriction enzyme
VDQRGERTDDPVTVHAINELTVVTDESYTAFVDGLQREVSESLGTRPGGAGAYPRPTDGRRRKRKPQQEENAGPREFAQHIAVDSGVLIGRCVVALNDRLKVAGVRYVVQRGELGAADLTGHAGITGSSACASGAHAETVAASSQVAYDLIGEIAAKTRLTRRTVASILRQVQAATFAQYRQNPGQFITEAARLINEQRDSLSAGTT